MSSYICLYIYTFLKVVSGRATFIAGPSQQALMRFAPYSIAPDGYSVDTVGANLFVFCTTIATVSLLSPPEMFFVSLRYFFPTQRQRSKPHMQ